MKEKLVQVFLILSLGAMISRMGVFGFDLTIPKSLFSGKAEIAQQLFS